MAGNGFAVQRFGSFGNLAASRIAPPEAAQQKNACNWGHTV